MKLKNAWLWLLWMTDWQVWWHKLNPRHFWNLMMLKRCKSQKTGKAIIRATQKLCDLSGRDDDTYWAAIAEITKFLERGIDENEIRSRIEGIGFAAVIAALRYAEAADSYKRKIEELKNNYVKHEGEAGVSDKA